MNQTPEIYEPVFVFRVLLLAAIVVLGSLAATGIYRRYTGLTRWQSALLCLLAAGLPVGGLLVYPVRGDRMQPMIGPAILIVFFSMLVFPFVVRLYRKWIGGHLTDEEKLPGIAGVRAWLTPGNLICAVLIPICAWALFQGSPPAMFALTFGLLLAYPVFNMVSAAPALAAATPPEDLSNEREKVLQLLEAGKINADESADLLNALGQSVPTRLTPPAEAGLSPARKLVLLGAALLLIGFFIPWFTINPGAVMNDMVANFQQNASRVTPGIDFPTAPQINFSGSLGTVQVHAGDVGHGLGWWILALGLAAAVLPFFATTLESAMQKKVILTALGVGVFLLFYLLSNALRYANLGVLLALAGYALEVVGTLKERPAAR